MSPFLLVFFMAGTKQSGASGSSPFPGGVISLYMRGANALNTCEGVTGIFCGVLKHRKPIWFPSTGVKTK